MTAQLLDTSALDQALSESNNPLIIFRDTLNRGTKELKHRFEKGAEVADLVHERAEMLDALLCRIWHRCIPEQAHAALVAVGGYGRGELHPASDIDLMILLGDEDPGNLREGLEEFLMFLWDIGLEVGHSVRTLGQCVEEAQQDITVVTNLMESRLLVGPNELFEAMRRATSPDRLWPSDRFFAAKLEEQQERHLKFGGTAYNLEPNVKEGPGGLRDIQMVGWVAKRHFGAETMHDLVSHGFLTEGEYQGLMKGQRFLWKIRFALHLLNKRREDRLLFDYQQTLASQFGYVDQKHNLAVEQLMQRYYRAVMELSRLNEMLLQLYEEVILLRNELGEPIHINKRFQSRNGYLEVTQDNIFQRYPIALLEVFLILQQHPELKGVRAHTIRLIRDHRHLIDDKFREDLRARSLFMEIMRQPRGITHELRRMNVYGVLAAYLPIFSNIVGRMQYDLFHVYTVDEHTLVVIRNLRRFAVEKHNEEFPLCSKLINTLPKLELLYLAGLFHDIAKGRGGDHSTLGAKDAREFCQQHGLSDHDSDLVSWLVEKHLTLSMTAQRKDTSDPEVIQAFAEEIGDPIRLKYLYLLTVADARATNPARWNTWKDALLRELYLSTRHALKRGLSEPQALDELIEERLLETRLLLTEAGVDLKKAEAFWSTLSEDYFQHTSANAIAWQTDMVIQAKPEHLPLVLVRRQATRGGTEVFLYGKDQDGLFTITTAQLDQLGLDIAEARVETTASNYTLNSFQVLEDNGKPIKGKARKQEIIGSLKEALSNAGERYQEVARRLPRRLRHFSTPTQVDFRHESEHHPTIMKLITSDRPGLLSEVGYAFAACNVRLHTAKIATIGALAEDMFFITDHDNQPLTNPEQLDCLKTTLINRLDDE